MHATSTESTDHMKECVELFIDSVIQDGQNSDTEQAFVNIKVSPKQSEVRFKLDTASSANAIPLYEDTKLSTHGT